MEQFNVKPLRSFIEFDKESRKSRFVEFCQFGSVQYQKTKYQETVIMSELKSIMRSPTKTRTSSDEPAKPTVFFNDNVEVNITDKEDNTDDSYTLRQNEKDVNINNNSIKSVTTKILETPLKRVLKYSDLESLATNCEIKLSDNSNESLDLNLCEKRKNAKNFNNNNTEMIIKDIQTSKDSQNFSTQDGNKHSPPTSPTSVSNNPEIEQQFPVVEQLIDFHERQTLDLTGRCAVKSTSLMGTSVLSAQKNSMEKLNDSEIINTLVRDRFVENMYESRSFRRNTAKKRCTYGRIYKSLERSFTIDNSQCKDNVLVSQNSPITNIDPFVFLNISPAQNCHLDDTIIGTNYEDKSVTVISDTERNYEDQLIKNSIAAEENVKFPEAHIATEGNQTYLNTNGRTRPVSNNEVDTSGSLNSTATNEIDRSAEKVVESLSETTNSYDMEDFLKRALGDELLNYNSTFDTTQETESKERDTKPVMEENMCTSDASDLVSKLSSFHSSVYRSLTKKLQRISNKLSPEPKDEQRECDELNSIFANNEQVTKLVHGAAVQFEAMRQITKALTLCRNTEEFTGSNEQIEGERLLLVATHKRQAILDEIRRLEYDDLEDKVQSMETGTVTISGLTFPARTDTSEQLVMRKDHNQWFVCILSHGLKVTATKPHLANPDGTLSFPDQVTFTDLPSDFNITLEIYSLLQRRSIRNFSHESKFHINKGTRSTYCPAPKKFLQKRKVSPKSPTRYEPGICTSSFKLCGSTKLNVADLSVTGPWQMRKVPLSSTLAGSVAMNLERYVHIPVRHSGFLTVGTGCHAWNRRWCVLDGHILRYWNYPDEEDTDPLRQIDLENCVNARIEVADRSICPRPRTLLLETAKVSRSDTENSLEKSSLDSCNIVQHLLSADNMSDLKIWESHLNAVITALHTWNVGCMR